MSPVIVTIEQVLGHQPFEVPFVQDDHVVKQVSSTTSNPTLSNTVLPRTAKGKAGGLAFPCPLPPKPHRLQTLSLGRIAGIGVAGGRPTLLAIAAQPRSIGISRHIEVQDLTPVVADDEKSNT
jgi:hypothetical protein